MNRPSAVIISGELADQHANTLQGLYDMNKRGIAVDGLFLGQVLDAIRSLRGLTTEQELFRKAWEGYTELSGVLYQRYLAGLTPTGEPVQAPATR